MQQAGDSHRTHAARNGGDSTRHLARGSEFNIAYQARRAIFFFDAVDAHIDDGCTRLDPVPLDHLGTSHCGYQDIRLTALAGKITGARMRDGDGTAFLQQQRRLR